MRHKGCEESRDTIIKALSHVPMQEHELQRLIGLYLLDETFDRGGIVEAERFLRARWDEPECKGKRLGGWPIGR